jgi:uroporphyrinogen-III decarboxylase
MKERTMTHRERFFALLEGRPVDRLPFFPDISDWYKARRTPAGEPQRFPTGALIPDGIDFHKVQHDMPPEWASWSYLDFYRNYDWGLPVHIYDWCNTQGHGYTLETKKRSTGAQKTVTQIWTTPHGVLTSAKEMAADGSFASTKYLVATLEDLDILEYIVTHTEVQADHERINSVLSQIGDMGVADLAVGRSPFGRIVQDYVGIEQTAYWMHDHRQRMLDLLASLEEQGLKIIESAARSDARIVIISDHADEALLNPRWYREFCIPFYQKACEILHDHGKIVSTHLDGNISGLLPLLKETGFDLLDGCTPAPMTNYRPGDLAAALGEGQCAYCGVPSTLFVQGLADSVILDSAEEIVQALKGRLILNVGDVLPPNGDVQQVIELGEWAKRRKP